MSAVVTLPTWEDKVKAEAMQFVTAVQHNFEHGLRESMKYLPNTEPETKLRQVDLFVDALVGLVVQIPGQFLGFREELRDALIEGIRYKYEYVMAKQAEVVAAAAKPT